MSQRPGSVSKQGSWSGGQLTNPTTSILARKIPWTESWQATVHRVTKSWAWLKWLSRSTTQRCMSCLHILKINHLSVAIITNIYSQSIGCLFLLFMNSLQKVKLKILIRYHLFLLLFLLSRILTMKILMQFMSNNDLPVFSFGSFMVSCLIFKFLSHFWIDFYVFCKGVN